MTPSDLVERLTAHRTLGAAPREELGVARPHGSFRTVNPGEVVAQKGQPVEELWVVLSGRIAIFVDRGTGVQKTVEWRTGDVTGLLPYSRLIDPPGYSTAQEPTEILALHRDQLPDMIQSCQAITHDPRALDARSRAHVQVERTARRENAIAWKAVGGPRARVEQSRVRHRAERNAA
jgi:CRP-like cAMP-binding protein